MVANEERLRVLKMVQDGIISAEEAVHLLEALEESAKPKKPKTPPIPSGPFIRSGGGRTLQVKVTDTDSGKIRVNVRLPLGVVKAGLKMGMRFVPEVDGMELDQLISQINDGAVGKIFEVYDEVDGEHVEIYVE
ncbi:MAG: hypothetical protein JEZ06_17585 [Anaerolineaceae bacterium]|nr:hypothetical protein [Anaerolineaceae bacterium]